MLHRAAFEPIAAKARFITSSTTPLCEEGITMRIAPTDLLFLSVLFLAVLILACLVWTVWMALRDTVSEERYLNKENKK